MKKFVFGLLMRHQQQSIFCAKKEAIGSVSHLENLQTDRYPGRREKTVSSPWGKKTKDGKFIFRYTGGLPCLFTIWNRWWTNRKAQVFLESGNQLNVISDLQKKSCFHRNRRSQQPGFVYSQYGHGRGYRRERKKVCRRQGYSPGNDGRCEEKHFRRLSIL